MTLHRAPGEQTRLPGSVGLGRRAALTIAALCATSVALSLSATPALAALKYLPATGFTNGFSFLTGNSIAPSDHNGHIYVADSGTGKVLDFTSPKDTFPAVWNGSKTPAGSFGGHVAVAVDNSNGDVYVADENHKVIDKFDENGNLITSFGDTTPSPNGQLAGTATPAGSFNPAGSYASFPIAVDQATHDLYVADANHQVVDIFDEDGTYLRQIVAPANLLRYGGSYVIGVAVNASTGNVYVADWAGPNLVFQFDSSGNYVRTLDGSNTPDGNFSGSCTGCSLISVATEDSTGKLFVGSMANRDFDVFDSSDNFIPPQVTGVGYTASGMAIDQSNGDVYVSNYESILIFKPVIVPDVNLGSVNSITPSSAILNGHVDPAGGGPITDCHFEYDSLSGTKETPCTTNPISSLPYASPTDVSANATGLTPGTPYTYRLIVSNANGSNESSSRFATVGRYQFSTDYGSAGSGDGQLSNPQDVAVEGSSGALYVADTGNHRVVKLDSSGDFLTAWGWGVSDGNATSEVCTSSCKAGLAGSGAGEFTTPTFIAVDNSSGPSAGDVYVADAADDVVQKFDSAGNLITAWGTNGATTYIGELAGIAVNRAGNFIVRLGAGYGTEHSGIAIDSAGNVFTGPTGIAIDTSTDNRYADEGDAIQALTGAGVPYDFFGLGNLNSAAGLTFNESTGALYAANAGDNDIAVFTPRPLPEAITAAVISPGPTTAVLTGHVDPNGAGNITECHFEYGTDTSYSLGSVPCSPGAPLSGPTNVSANLIGLTPFTTYHFRLVVAGADDLGLSNASRDRTFTPAPGSPVIDSTTVSDLTPTSATLNADINPNSATTIYRFQYGNGTGYGSQTVPSEPIGEDSTDHAVTAELSGLSPGTTYHFRVLAINFNGTTYGPDQTFTTPDVPSVVDSAATGITQTSATVGAGIRPGFRPTTYHVEYGLTSLYGLRTPESALIGSDNSIHPTSAIIVGLTPAATYHFRIVANNSIGTADGPDQTFTTAAAPPLVTPPPPKCKSGFVDRHGGCVKTHRHRRKHHGSSR